MAVLHQSLVVLACFSSSFYSIVAGSRINRLNRLPVPPTEEPEWNPVEPRLPRFGGGGSDNGDAPSYVRLANTRGEMDPFETVTTKVDCGKSYLVEDDHTVMIYSRHYLKAYMCDNTFSAAGESSMLYLECPDFNLNFMCFFEQIAITLDGGPTKSYCGGSKLPPINAEEIRFTYKTLLWGFRGGYVCALIAKGPEKNETASALPSPSTSKAMPRCGVSGAMENTNNHHRIVGGQAATKGEYPWMALLKIVVGSRKDEYFCGGSLFTETQIITAGHCLHGYNVQYIEVALGMHNKLSNNEVGVIWRRATTYTVHEHYNDDLILHDIAIVTLPERISFSEYVAPICLPQADLVVPSRTVLTATGWGSLSYGGSNAIVLQEVELNEQPNWECEDDWQRKFSDYEFSIFDNQMCAHGLNKDTCSGDSGGPLMMMVEDAWVLIGITSFGYRCADPDVAGVYTRLIRYLEWINRNI